MSDPAGIGYHDYKDILDLLKDLLIRKFGEDLVSIVLYGSVCRNEAKRESDIDILIVLKNPPETYYERLSDFVRIEKELSETPEYKKLLSRGLYPQFNFIIFSEEEAMKNRYIYLDMIEDSMIIYDKNNFFSTKLKEMELRLRALGSKKVVLSDGSWYWDIKPDLKLGEEFEL